MKVYIVCRDWEYIGIYNSYRDALRGVKQICTGSIELINDWFNNEIRKNKQQTWFDNDCFYEILEEQISN